MNFNCETITGNRLSCVLLTNSETKFTLLARGYTDYETLSARLDAALKD